MAFNALATATIFQTTLDQIATQEALTGWMEANAGQVIYNGGAEVKIPKINMDGMADYDRDAGYTQGGVTLTFGTYTMTQDRGRKFQLDAMDVNENNFVTTGATVMGEFQRTKVIPEIDAYRLSKCITLAIAKNAVEYGYTPAVGSMLSKIKKGIKQIRENGYNGELVIHINFDSLEILEEEIGGKITRDNFTVGGIDTRVPFVDGCPLIGTPSNRMYSAIALNDGKSSGQTAGGYKKASSALDCNFIIMPRTSPIAVSKQDKMKIFTPDQNQDADAWKMNYRRFHDLWVPENKQDSLYACIKDAKPGV